MCKTCGCSAPVEPPADHAHAHDHVHSPEHAHSHDHPPLPRAAVVRLQRKLLDGNDRSADANRRWFAERGILALNLVSSPGAGKTTLLESTIRDWTGEFPIQVIEGDQATDNDARRIRAVGGRAVQINTGAGCHLDADMVARGLRELDPPDGSLVLIENVGNLVCPALFDLGERAKALVCSVTEGDDKPIKYPHMFRAATVLILNKIDLLPHVPFDLTRFHENVNLVNPRLSVIPVSATRGDGLADWYAWLQEQMSTAGASQRMRQ